MRIARAHLASSVTAQEPATRHCVESNEGCSKGVEGLLQVTALLFDGKIFESRIEVWFGGVGCGSKRDCEQNI
jgi:hypothetical protein